MITSSALLKRLSFCFHARLWHCFQKIKSINYYCYFILGFLGYASISYAQVDLLNPKLLSKAREKKIITLNEAINNALKYSANLSISRNHLEQRVIEKGLILSLFLPKIKLGMAYTHNIPEVETSFLNVAAESNMRRQMAGLLRQANKIAEADAMDKEADLMQRRGAKSSIVINPENVIDGKLSLEIPLFNSKVIANYMASRENVYVSEANVDLEKSHIIYSSCELYFLALYLKRLVDIRQAALFSSEALFSKTQDKHKRGLIRYKDFLASKSSYLSKEAEKEEALLNLGSTKAYLGLLMDVKEDFDIDITIDKMTFDILNINEDNLLNMALLNRKDIKMYEHALKANQQERIGNYGQFLPTIGFKADANYTSNEDNLMGKKFTYALSLNALWPIFDGGSSLLSLRQSSLKEQENEIKLRELKNAIMTSVNGYKEKLRILVIKDKALLVKRDAEEEAFNVAVSMFNRGLITMDDFLDKENKKISSQIEYEKSQLDMLLEKLFFMREIGLLNEGWAQIY